MEINLDGIKFEPSKIMIHSGEINTQAALHYVARQYSGTEIWFRSSSRPKIPPSAIEVTSWYISCLREVGLNDCADNVDYAYAYVEPQQTWIVWKNPHIVDISDELFESYHKQAHRLILERLKRSGGSASSSLPA